MPLTTLHSGPDQTKAKTLEEFFGGTGVDPRRLDDRFTCQPAEKDVEYIPNLALPQSDLPYAQMAALRGLMGDRLAVDGGPLNLMDEIRQTVHADLGKVEGEREEVRGKIIELFRGSIKGINFPADGQSIVRSYSPDEAARFVNEEELEAAAELISGVVNPQDLYFTEVVAHYRMGILAILDKLTDMVRIHGNPRHAFWHLGKLTAPSYLAMHQGEQINVPLMLIPWEPEDEKKPSAKSKSGKKLIVPYRREIMDGRLKQVEFNDFNIKNQKLLLSIGQKFPNPEHPMRKFIVSLFDALSGLGINVYFVNRWAVMCLGSLDRIRFLTGPVITAIEKCTENLSAVRSEEELISLLRLFIGVDLPKAMRAFERVGGGKRK